MSAAAGIVSALFCLAPLASASTVVTMPRGARAAANGTSGGGAKATSVGASARGTDRCSRRRTSGTVSGITSSAVRPLFQ